MPDLGVLRDDFGGFAAFVGRPRTEAQARAVPAVPEARTTALLGHRQCGKTDTLAVWSVHQAFRRPGVTVLVVSASESAAREAMRKVRSVVAHPLLAGAVLDESGMRLTLSNGSRIIAVPASSAAIRGLTVDVLVIDEAAFVSDEVWLAAVGTTAARPGAIVVYASTPWAPSGFFFDHVRAGGSEHVRVVRLTLEDSPWVSASFIESMRQSLPAQRFATEYLLSTEGGGGGWFGRRLIERATVDVMLPEFGPVLPARPFVGVDYGSTNDQSVVAAISRLAGVHLLNPDVDPRRPVYVASTRPFPRETPLGDVAREVARQPVAYAMVTTEVNGVGRGPSEDLGGRLPASPREPREPRGGLLAARASAVGGGRSARAVPRLVNELEGDRDPLVRELDARRHAARAARPVDAPPPTLLNAHTTSMESKVLVYERLRHLMERGQLLVPNEPELLRQLIAVEAELLPGGGVRIGASGSGHDDHADAIFLAAGPYRDRRGRLVCALAVHADRPTPTAEVPDLDELVVTSGAGLRVYSRPPLQSVAGQGVSLPPGVRVRPVPEDPRWGGVRAGVAAALRDELAGHNDRADGAEGA